MTTSGLPASTWLGILLIVLGLLFFFQQLGWFSIGRALSLLWPLLLIYLGWTLYRQGQQDVGGEPGNVIHRSTFFGDFKVDSAGRDLRAVRVWSLIGDGTIDLRYAALADGAVLDAVMVFGDLTVYVPAGTRIEANRPVLVGDVELPSAPAEAASVLRLTGFSLFGDVRVRAD